jgi:hypothetical protein
MPKNPYAPPSADVADLPRPEPTRARPKQVAFATLLLWIGLVLSLPGLYLAASRSEDGFHPVVMGVSGAMYVFAAVLNVLIYRGYNWARIVTLILTLISLPMYFLDEPIPLSATETALNLVVLLLEVVALYLIFTNPGALWFKRATHR